MQTRSKSNQSGNKFQTSYVTSKSNPLCIPEIVDHIFNFLNLADIKNCRSVCEKWNQLAEKFLKKLSVVKISNANNVEKFNQEFPNAQEMQLSTCFRFLSFKWPLYKCEHFFKKWNPTLSELTLIRPRFESYDETETYNLSLHLPSTLTKLRIDSCKPIMMISTDTICNIRILDLENCIIDITGGTTLNNEEIKLDRVKFWKKCECIKEFLINPLLNFDGMKKASFSGKSIKLDLQGSHSLDTLSLQLDTTVLNWKTSNWKIKKLFLGVYPCKEMKEDLSQSQIQYKKLKIRPQNLIVSYLPECIVKLQLSFYNHDEESDPRISGEHNFPNLNHLEIHMYKKSDFSAFVNFFKHCPKLTTLTVQQFQGGGSIFKTSSVPLSVKTLRVCFGVQIIVDRSLQLESLILYNVHIGRRNDNIVDVVKELNVKNLIWVGLHRDHLFWSYYNIFDNKKGHNFKSVIDLHLDNFLVGDFSLLDDSEFEKSIFFPLVNTQGIYYLFLNDQKGKALSDSKLTFKTLTQMLKRWMPALK